MSRSAPMQVVIAGAGIAGQQCLQRRYPLLEDVRRRIHDSGVDVPEFFEGKEIGGVLGALEHKRGRLVDGHGARPSG